MNEEDMGQYVSLYEIIARKRADVEELKVRFPLSKIIKAVERNSAEEERRDFKKALVSPHGINIIGEIKKASPSEGVIRHNFNALQIADIYERNNIKAISVLTEMHYFKGRPSYLKTIRQITQRPILRKDFIIDRYQLYESALYSADAVLLITSVLTDDELQSFIAELRAFGIQALVEVHNQQDLGKALDADADIIGINNRNLNTFEVDLQVTEQMVRKIPKGKLIVSESGIHTFEDIQRLKSLGINTFLIGTTFMRSANIAATIKELTTPHS